MMNSRALRGAKAGFTLIELMIALVVLGLIMGSAVAVFRSQSANFRFGGQKLEVSQNLRYTLGTVDRVLRTTGAGTVSNQPMFVYGDNNTVAVNTNYTDSISTGVNSGVYVNPDAPTGSYTVLLLGAAYQLPNTVFTYPSKTYLDPNGTPSDAETIVFYFRPDSTTADPLDFMLMQRTNALPGELVARNIYAYPGRPFFEYYVHPRTLLVPPAPRDSLVLSTLVAGMVPIQHTIPDHGSSGDTAGTGSAIADSVNAVRINVRVTNGQLGTLQRFQDVSTTVKLPNNGLIPLHTCGSPPIFGGPFTIAPTILGSPAADTLRWTASTDEAAGERDVLQYNIYRKLHSVALFGPAMQTQPAGQANYIVVDRAVVRDSFYDYAVSAVDCTPRESPLLTVLNVKPD